MLYDRVVECIPNFSEGRRPEVVEAIVTAIRSVEGVKLLDYSSDPTYNRSVVTFAGSPEAVKEAAFRATARAAELINMEEHRGAHPRIGATDVIPFVPLRGVSMEECVALAVELAREIAERLGIPTYLYEEAARRPERKNLADIRRGDYEGLKLEIERPERQPDFGPSRLHPTAGATVVGARPPLIAYNINLDTPDLAVAKKIANKIREARGGLPAVKAIGVEIKEKNITQVSINLTDYSRTSLYRLFETVKAEAQKLGTQVTGSEIVGLIPMGALIDLARDYLGLESFKPEQVLELKLFGE